MSNATAPNVPVALWNRAQQISGVVRHSFKGGLAATKHFKFPGQSGLGHQRELIGEQGFEDACIQAVRLNARQERAHHWSTIRIGPTLVLALTRSVFEYTGVTTSARFREKFPGTQTQYDGTNSNSG